MKKYENIDQELANYLNGFHTEQEEIDAKEWAKASKDNSYQFSQLQQYWQERTSDPKLINHENQKSKIWNSLQTEPRTQKSARQRFLPKINLWRAAAIILLLIVPSLLPFRQYVTQETSQAVVADNEIVKHNPAGQKSHIHLPDGSTIWLNSESTISYSQNFSNSSRKVKLEGEAFFEVMRDTTRPFYVEMENFRVSVLGTKFNVSAYHDDAEITVALLQGSIKVSRENEDGNEIMLSSGRAMSYSKETEVLDTFSIMDDQYFYAKNILWKSGTLVFNGRNFEDFITDISRWYGLKVTVSGNPPADWQIRASFENEYLNNLLDAISFNKDFDYELRDKELELKFY